MANEIHGMNMTLTLAGGTRLNITSQDTEHTSDNVNVTSCSSGGNHEFLPGIKGASGTYTWNIGTATGETVPELNNATFKDTLAVVQGYHNEAGTGGPSFSYTAIIDSIRVTGSFDSQITGTVSWTRTGATTQS